MAVLGVEGLLLGDERSGQVQEFAGDGTDRDFRWFASSPQADVECMEDWVAAYRTHRRHI